MVYNWLFAVCIVFLIIGYIHLNVRFQQLLGTVKNWAQAADEQVNRYVQSLKADLVDDVTSQVSDFFDTIDLSSVKIKESKDEEI